MTARRRINWDYRPRTYETADPTIEYPLLGQAPGFGGGSYLPSPRGGEVEIAGLALDSTTGDVISIRVKRVDSGYRYRVVDEYGTKFRVAEPIRPQPLTLRELVELIDTVQHQGTAGLFETYLNLNWEGLEGHGDPAQLRRFITPVSPFYRQLEQVYASRADAWVEGRRLDQCASRRHPASSNAGQPE